MTALGTFLVEPSFFGSMSKFTFEELDKEMVDLISLARAYTSNFCIVEYFGLPIVVRL